MDHHILVKCAKIFRSCQTIDQFIIAKKYKKLAIKKTAKYPKPVMECFDIIDALKQEEKMALSRIKGP